MPRFIRVLIVDDSALIRQLLTRALSMDPRVEIAGIARTGVEAIERARELDPDVITLDIEMPEMSGLEALPHIRRHTDARVVILSSLDDPDITYRAMALGAVDFVPKPAGVASSMTELSELLLKTIKTASRIDPVRARSVSTGLAQASADDVDDLEPGGCRPGDPGPCACVALAASTGGPPVLERAFAGFSAAQAAAYVVVQHLPTGFSASLARRLSAAGAIEVVEAEDGMLLRNGCGYLARHGAHLRLVESAEGSRFAYADGPPLHGVRPAADPLFESVAEHFGEYAVGVVLTGMGSDGAAGALAIRRAGGEVLVQDEATSVVWGMPGAAMRIGAATRTISGPLVAAEVRRAIRAVTEGVAS